MKEEKKKWVMPKFLPYKYDVKLINEDKVNTRVFLHFCDPARVLNNCALAFPR